MILGCVDRVYPRTHGETQMNFSTHGINWGLSPYTRGNQSLDSSLGVPPWSIPVHTGKPKLIDLTRKIFSFI